MELAQLSERILMKEEKLKHYRNSLREIDSFYKSVENDKDVFSRKNFLIFESLFMEMQRLFHELEKMGMSESELQKVMIESAEELGTAKYNHISLKFIDMTTKSVRFLEPLGTKPN